ncbi:hypothetical protein [Agrobacterium sp. CG674]
MYSVRDILARSLIAVSFSISLPMGSAVSEERQKPCIDLAGEEKTNCDAAWDLLTRDAEKIPEYVIHARGKIIGWTFRYDVVGGECVLSNELRLPKGQTVALNYTSIDYDSFDAFPKLWISTLGIDITALPGRVSTINVTAPHEGKLEAKASQEALGSNTTNDATKRLTVPAEVVSVEAYKAWIGENARTDCES